MALARLLSTGLLVVGASAACEFEVLPATPFTWDVDCKPSVPGCNADGKHLQCRYCGAKPFLPCHVEGKITPPGSAFCTFKSPPKQSFTWDDTCTGGVPGCGADGHHLQCRFCGEAPFLPCPDTHTGDKCTFDFTPSHQYTWDTKCHDGMKGCKADLKHMQCRFCGDTYDPCPTCEFDEEPNKPYTWDSNCLSAKYMHGCKADGKHYGCRFCGKGYEPCPTTTATSTTATATSTSTLTTTVTQTTTTETTVTTTTRRGLRFKDYESGAVGGKQLASFATLVLCLVASVPVHL